MQLGGSMTARERARKKIAERIALPCNDSPMDWCPHYAYSRCEKHSERDCQFILVIADRILAIPEIGVISDGENVPGNPYAPEDLWARKAYSRAQQDMLNDSWKRMEK